MEQNEFAEAAGEAMESCSSSLEADSVLRALLAEEGERVAEAIAFAEVLVPMLAERLSVAQPLASRPSPGGPGMRRQRAGTVGETPAIADFIDEMLAQDRPGAR